MSETVSWDEDGVGIVGDSVYFSLGSKLWTNLTGGGYASATYSYTPPGSDVEFATMNMANWGQQGAWYSAKMRLAKRLGFGKYEQSIKVGKGSGITTTFYLSEWDKDKEQEIDFEFSGHCDPAQDPCGTQFVWTNIWGPNQGDQHGVPENLWSGNSNKPSYVDSTSGWGNDVYRYMIDWEPDVVTWCVDRTGTGDHYEMIRAQYLDEIGVQYDKSLLVPFISFWQGWTPDGSPFLNGQDASGNCGPSGKCYQAFYFQPLKFTPSAKNRQVKLNSQTLVRAWLLVSLRDWERGVARLRASTCSREGRRHPRPSRSRQAGGSRNARIGFNDAGVSGEGLAADRAGAQAGLQHALEQQPECVAVTEAAMPRLGKAGALGNLARQADAAKPAISEIEVNLFDEPPFGTNAVEIADQQHPDHQLGIERRATQGAVMGRGRVAPRAVQHFVGSEPGGARRSSSCAITRRRIEQGKA